MARVSLIAASGLCAGLAALAALAVAAERRNRSPWRPINATSHWIHGPRSGSVSRPDLAHTGTGFTTHMLASFWWALPFSAMIGRSARPSPSRVVAAAAGTTALAALVDYGLVPKRLTPAGNSLCRSRTDDGLCRHGSRPCPRNIPACRNCRQRSLPFDDQETTPVLTG